MSSTDFESQVDFGNDRNWWKQFWKNLFNASVGHDHEGTGNGAPIQNSVNAQYTTLNTATDANSCTTNGGRWSIAASSSNNCPDSTNDYYIDYVGSTTNGTQTASIKSSLAVYRRTLTSSTWGSWTQIIDSTGAATNASSATYWDNTQIIASGYLTATNTVDTISLGDITVPTGKQLVIVVNQLYSTHFERSDTSKTLKVLGTVDSIYDTFGINCYGTFTGYSAGILVAGTYTSQTIKIYHSITSAYNYTDGTNDDIVSATPVFYIILEVDA